MSVTLSYASPFSGTTPGDRPQSRFKERIVSLFGGLVTFAAAIFPGASLGQNLDTNRAPPSAAGIEGTNFEQLVRTSLQLQGELQATHLAVEQNRQEIKEAAVQNAEALSNGLLILQEVFSAQGAREFEVVQRSNKVMLAFGGTLAAIGFVAVLLMTYFQWRTSKCLAEISAGWSTGRGVGFVDDVSALEESDRPSAPGALTQQSSLRLLGAIEDLDRHIRQFKRVLASADDGRAAISLSGGPAAVGGGRPDGDERGRISALLDRAHFLMNGDDPEAALACFNEVLSLDPNHTQALVKKGAALERQHKLNEAIECYDRAIAADDCMTIAYLHKGGLCNRLERFREALECYEKALRTHDQRGG